MEAIVFSEQMEIVVHRLTLRIFFPSKVTDGGLLFLLLLRRNFPMGPIERVVLNYEWLSGGQKWYPRDCVNEWLHNLPVWWMAFKKG